MRCRILSFIYSYVYGNLADYNISTKTQFDSVIHKKRRGPQWIPENQKIDTLD